MRILVTGANGFIGSHLAKQLLADGHRVYSLVTPFEASEALYLEMLKGTEVIPGDLRDKFSLDLAIRKANPEVVFHLGALTSVRQSLRNPVVFSETNYLGTIKLLTSCSQHAPNLRKFINVTTAECLRSRPEPHTEENFEYGWNSPYGVSKTAAELYCKYAYKVGMPVINVRPNNAFHRKTSRHFLVETIITQMLEERKLVLQGTTETKRNWTLIDDLVDAFLAVMDRGEVGKLYHLANPDNIYSIGELIGHAKRVLGWDGELVTGTKPRPYDPKCLTLDSVKFDELGWRPNYGIDECIRIVADYWKDRL